MVLGYLPPALLAATWRLISPAPRPRSPRSVRHGALAEDAAKGIIDIANEVMLGALRIITVQRGLDPRDFGIVAFGGAGSAACQCFGGTARLLSGAGSAEPRRPVGAWASSKPNSRTNSCRPSFVRPDGLDARELWSRFATLGEKAKAWLDEQEVRRVIAASVFVDLRYEQQGFEVTIEVPAKLVAESGSIDEILDRFHATHQRLYGVRFHVPVELVALRAIAIGATPNVEEALPEQGHPDLTKALMEMRPCYFGGAWVDTPNYDRTKLAIGTKITGPAIIRQ